MLSCYCNFMDGTERAAYMNSDGTFQVECRKRNDTGIIEKGKAQSEILACRYVAKIEGYVLEDGIVVDKNISLP